ncbi:MAG: isopenicillin N synthase family oxygenase [Deltaproteobacteria bacterium]|nr:MAG: isopenicillin N synthase family oxygenase [Deltaproteobacteria bacterium]
MRIPIVNFEGFLCQPPRRSATAAALRAAFESYGFLYLRNHGVPESVLDAVLAQSRAFFALSQEAKLAVKSRIKGSTRGYGSLGSQSLDEKQPGDLKEIFQAGPERPGARPNVWPDGLPGFREAVLAFQQGAMETCNQLMRAIAVSLGLPEGYFALYHDRSDSTARLLHYPPIPATPLPGQIRAGAHTDFGGLSLLFQDGEGGLEIQGPEGVWIAAPALPGMAIVNTGDLIERWTNGQFRSSSHRVVNPSGPAAGRHRYSVVLFHSPNPDAVIECLASCQSPERQPKYPPITAGEHMLARIRASRPGGY